MHNEVKIRYRISYRFCTRKPRFIISFGFFIVLSARLSNVMYTTYTYLLHNVQTRIRCQFNFFFYVILIDRVHEVFGGVTCNILPCIQCTTRVNQQVDPRV